MNLKDSVHSVHTIVQLEFGSIISLHNREMESGPITDLHLNLICSWQHNVNKQLVSHPYQIFLAKPKTFWTNLQYIYRSFIFHLISIPTPQRKLIRKPAHQWQDQNYKRFIFSRADHSSTISSYLSRTLSFIILDLEAAGGIYQIRFFPWWWCNKVKTSPSHCDLRNVSLSLTVFPFCRGCVEAEVWARCPLSVKRRRRLRIMTLRSGPRPGDIATTETGGWGGSGIVRGSPNWRYYSWLYKR